MNPLRRWWRAFTSRLHTHNDDDCADCLSLIVMGYLMAGDDAKARREGLR